MFADPASITIGGTAFSLARVMTSGRASKYATADGNRILTISHEVDDKDYKRGESHLIKLTHRKLTTNPFNNLNEWVEAHVWIVVKQPNTGWTDTELKDALAGLIAYFNSGNQDKFLGNEH